jgi:hypothetical protein
MFVYLKKNGMQKFVFIKANFVQCFTILANEIQMYKLLKINRLYASLKMKSEMIKLMAKHIHNHRLIA